MKLLRWVVVTLIIAAIVAGITEAICGVLKSNLADSNGLVLASDLVKLKYSPHFAFGLVALFSFLIHHEVNKDK